MSKRTLDTFFKPITPSAGAPNKKPKAEPEPTSNSTPNSYTNHPSYPHPIANLPPSLSTSLPEIKDAKGKEMKNHPHLDLLYFHPLIPQPTARELFTFLRNELPFYRVQYPIQRGGVTTQINTPRFTTVFGIDETGIFIPQPQPHPQTQAQNRAKEQDYDKGSKSKDAFASLKSLDSKTHHPIPPSQYQYTPRPIPPCLDILRQHVQSAINANNTNRDREEGDATFNFCLVNYYATGNDSIAYHSDDERFLGSNPTIASISLGAQRDFLLKHKPTTDSGVSNKPLKFNLGSGDMLVMRGETQANWVHSIPKRKGGDGLGMGRINITLRKAITPGGTNNYYNYNVGRGVVYRWDDGQKEMVAQIEKGEGEN